MLREESKNTLEKCLDYKVEVAEGEGKEGAKVKAGSKTFVEFKPRDFDISWSDDGFAFRYRMRPDFSFEAKTTKEPTGEVLVEGTEVKSGDTTNVRLTESRIFEPNFIVTSRPGQVMVTETVEVSWSRMIGKDKKKAAIHDWLEQIAIELGNSPIYRMLFNLQTQISTNKTDIEDKLAAHEKLKAGANTSQNETHKGKGT